MFIDKPYQTAHFLNRNLIIRIDHEIVQTLSSDESFTVGQHVKNMFRVEIVCGNQGHIDLFQFYFLFHDLYEKF